MSDTTQRELDGLPRMTTGELAERYEQLHGQPCRTRHRAYLIRKIAWRLQANAEGDLSERARRRAAELANDAEVRVMAPRTVVSPPQPGVAVTSTRRVPNALIDVRLPPAGSAIVRQYKGRKLRVVVLPDGQGLEYEGERYRTLSAVAKRITGSHINGFRFFHLEHAQ
ncbi:MAG: hypothetical protein HBSAPP03_23600 [Phycisphaerae bacterium]|nr:MAG: hypothetical protein HBSAPP03_23600 [Phycisphaerae bacterium]